MPANSQPLLVQGSLALATLAIAVASLCFGQYPLSLSAVGHTLVHLPPGEGVIGQIVWSVRLPRVVMALLAGGALGLCGAKPEGGGQQATMVSPYQQTGEVRDHQTHPGDAAADRHLGCHQHCTAHQHAATQRGHRNAKTAGIALLQGCLLYTSDAADE